MPPSSAKIGAPRTPATSMHDEPRPERVRPRAVPGCWATQKPATMPSAAMARPIHAGDARQARRSAISAKATGKASVDDPDGHADGDDVAGLALASDEARAPPTAKIVAIAAPTKPADDVRGRADAAFGQELAGGEREQLAFARGDGRAEQADPEREVQRERRRRRDARCRQAAAARSRERQQHDAAERERGEEVLGADGGCPHLLAFGLAERVALAHGHVVDVGRHHVAAHRRDELLGRGAELGRRLRDRASSPSARASSSSRPSRRPASARRPGCASRTPSRRRSRSRLIGRRRSCSRRRW